MTRQDAVDTARMHIRARVDRPNWPQCLVQHLIRQALREQARAERRAWRARAIGADRRCSSPHDRQWEVAP